MRDPFPFAPPAFLVSATKPLADTLSLHSLPLHVHEILFAAAFYTVTEKAFSPWISKLLFPRAYARLSRRARLNWDVHVVSFVQSCLINALCLYIIWYDEERKALRSDALWEQRIWAYYGIGGLAQSFALGYFLWDLYTCSVHVDIFGWGMLAHAISAVAVFGFGYRPFIYFYAPVFLLYELSSPFLNVHWFCDKLDLTGSTIQAVNGAFLVLTFFSCRIIWGLYSSYRVFWDVWRLVAAGQTNYAKMVPLGRTASLGTHELLAYSRDEQAQLNAFNREGFLPLWIPIVYLTSNVILNSLNIFWFGKMIETIRTRFDPPYGTKGLESNQSETKEAKVARAHGQAIPQLSPEGGTVEERADLQTDGAGKGGSVRAARARAEEAMNGPIGTIQDTKIERPLVNDADLGVEATGSARKNARSRRKA